MIHSSATPRSLGFVRIVVFGTWLFLIVRTPLDQLSGLPSDFFEAVGMIRLLPESAANYILHPVFLLSLKWILSLGLLLCLLGQQPYRAISISTVLVLTFQQSLVRGFGHINHRELPLLYAAWVLVLFPAAQGLTFKRAGDDSTPSPASALALQTMTVLLLLSYVGPAAYRIAYSAPEIFLNQTMGHFLALSAVGTPYYGMHLEEWILCSPLLVSFMSAGFALVTMMELLSPLCLILPRFRATWLAVMIPFHFSTLLFMNIFFWHNLLLFGVLLVDAGRALPGKERQQEQSRIPRVEAGSEGL